MMIAIFSDHIMSPDFAENTYMAEELVYQTILNFGSHFIVKKLWLIARFLQ